MGALLASSKDLDDFSTASREKRLDSNLQRRGLPGPADKAARNISYQSFRVWALSKG